MRMLRRITTKKKMSRWPGKDRGRILRGMMLPRFGGSSVRLPLGSTAVALMLAACLVAVLPAVPGSSIARAEQRGPAQRIVSGKVVDKGDTPLKGSVVYLKDDKTLSVKSFIADDGGGFRFGQLSQGSDYELWAELNGKKSNTRTISSFDNKNEFVINLKIDTAK